MSDWHRIISLVLARYISLDAAELLLDASKPANQVVADYIASLPSPINVTTDGRIADCSMTPAAPLCPPVPVPLNVTGLVAQQSGTQVREGCMFVA